MPHRHRLQRVDRDGDLPAATVAALTAPAVPVVIEGAAAGAGKTTLLAAARDQLDRQGQRLIVVTPTLKAAASRQR